MGRGDTLLNAVVGAVVTVVFSFTGFSPLAGGGVAGYLQAETRTQGAMVGALSGALSFLPFLFLAVLGFGVLALGPMAGAGFPGGIELLVVLFVALPLFLLWTVGLGAVGGYLGTYLYEEFATTDGQAPG